jgi:hypothetical protein
MMRNLIILSFIFLSFSIFTQIINYDVTGFKIRLKRDEKWTNWTKFNLTDGYIKIDLNDSLIILKFKLKDDYSTAIYPIINHEIQIVEEDNTDIVEYFLCILPNGEKINLLFSFNKKAVLITEKEVQALYTYENK